MVSYVTYSGKITLVSETVPKCPGVKSLQSDFPENKGWDKLNNVSQSRHFWKEWCGLCFS